MMDWLWVFFAVVWTPAVIAFARTIRRATKRWNAQGFVSNSLGTTIRKQHNPTMFGAMIVGMRAFSAIGFLFAIAGIAICLGWVWKALT